MKKKTIAICGSGIAGVATAYYLLEREDNVEVILIDKYQPLSFTTSKSGENFRDYWPQECLQQFASQSISLMKKLLDKYGDTSFEMVNSGYDFISHSKEKSIFGVASESEFNNDIEEITNSETIQTEYPYLDSSVQKIVTIKKAGKIDVYALGSLLVRESKKKGANYVTGEIQSIKKEDGKFQLLLDSKECINADMVVIAAGPFINHVANMLGLQFLVSNTIQRKFVIPDPLNIIPRNMPFTIYADSQFLDWSDDEKTFFSSEEKYGWLLEEFPGGIHIKPESAGIKLGWAFQKDMCNPSWDIPGFELFPQVVLKGASRFIPQLIEYETEIPTPLIEYAGHYTRTKENLPLIGSTKMENVYVVGALAGYGTMSACAAGELCSTYILDDMELPNYATYFHPERYQNPKICEEIKLMVTDGQL